MKLLLFGTAKKLFQLLKPTKYAVLFIPLNCVINQLF